MFKDYFPLIMLVVGIGIGYLLTRIKKKETEEAGAEEVKGPDRKRERLDYDVVVMEEETNKQ